MYSFIPVSPIRARIRWKLMLSNGVLSNIVRYSSPELICEHSTDHHKIMQFQVASYLGEILK